MHIYIHTLVCICIYYHVYKHTYIYDQSYMCLYFKESRVLQNLLQKESRSQQSEWPLLSLQIMNAGEGVEKREASYVVGRDVN